MSPLELIFSASKKLKPRLTQTWYLQLKFRARMCELYAILYTLGCVLPRGRPTFGTILKYKNSPPGHFGFLPRGNDFRKIEDPLPWGKTEQIEVLVLILNRYATGHFVQGKTFIAQNIDRHWLFFISHATTVGKTESTGVPCGNMVFTARFHTHPWELMQTSSGSGSRNSPHTTITQFE